MCGHESCVQKCDRIRLDAQWTSLCSQKRDRKRDRIRLDAQWTSLCSQKRDRTKLDAQSMSPRIRFTSSSLLHRRAQSILSDLCVCTRTCVRVLFKAGGWPVLKHAPQKSSWQGFQLGCRSEPLAWLLPGLLVSTKHLAGLRWRHPSGRCWAPGQPLLASEA